MDPPLVVRQTVSRKPSIKYKFYQVSQGNPTKRQITDAKKITYLKKIRVPPTYTRVTLSLNPKSRLQGVGYDSTGQKQYFYSPLAIKSRSKDKYCGLLQLADHLGKIQTDIDRHLRSGQITEPVLNALALKIMFICNFRIGHPRNVKQHQTYGVTTINGKHLKLKKSKAWIEFVGKKQQWNLCLIEDPQILRFLKRLAQNHKQLSKAKSNVTLFTWNGYTVTPRSLNGFLTEYHPDITSKTWRTWFANVEYIRRIGLIQIPDQATYRKKASNLVIQSIAEDLHHTPAICKRNYLISDLAKIYTDHPDKWQKIQKQTHSTQPEKFLAIFLKGYCRKA